MHNALTPNSSNDCYISSVAREGYLGDAGCFCPRLIVVLAPGAQGRKFTVTGAGGDSTYTIETNEHAVQGEGGCVYSFDSGLSEEWVIISGKPAQILTSTLEKYGSPGGHSAMAVTVGVPCGIATQLVLDGVINTPGVLAPYTKEICEPIRAILEREGLGLVERVL
ncbi:hypothetical protein EV401DRAFT_2080076 [Pisolithus croceorrhizus]|nr:hypothetical protein EV401DRAFT_2080076 [Pisolithus croceorrhizus]